MKQLIQHHFYAFLLALSFLTRIPIPINIEYSNNKQKSSFIYYPLVGLLIGLLQFVVIQLLMMILPLNISIILTMAFSIFLTGALHEDGLADVFDGFGGGKNRDHIITIMKDSHLGTYGILSLVFTELIIYFSLISIDKSEYLLVFILKESLTRFLMLIPMNLLDYVSNESSKSKGLVAKLSKLELIFASLLILILLVIYFKMSYLISIFITFIFTLLLSYYFFKKLGGYNGDCLGATQKLSEVIFLLSVLALI